MSQALNTPDEAPLAGPPALLERRIVRVSAEQVKDAPGRKARAQVKEELCEPAEFTARWWRAPDAEE